VWWESSLAERKNSLAHSAAWANDGKNWRIQGRSAKNWKLVYAAASWFLFFIIMIIFVFYFLSGVVFLMSGLLSEKSTALRLVAATVLQTKLDSPHPRQTLSFPTQKKQQKEEEKKKSRRQ
jgi:hypothetical protein